MASNKYCVIMAGGIGSRFWPKSRQSMPKQFLDILGTGKSFIRHTYERFAKIVPPENFLVVTNDKYKRLVLEHIPEIGEKQVLCEPVGRNTAPCVAYAAYTLLKRNPDAEMIVTPADHLILNEDDFRAIIAECLDFRRSEHDALMTVGIKPTRPDTGYGYIQVSDNRPISKVKCFTEKPDLELAQVFLQIGRILLELGNLRVDRAARSSRLSEKYLPEHHAMFSGVMQRASAPTPSRPRAGNRLSRSAAPSRSTTASWRRPTTSTSAAATSAGATSARGARSTSTRARTATPTPFPREGCYLYDTRSSRSSRCRRSKIAVISGLKEYIVVDTDDVLLICPRAEEQNIKKFIDEVKFNNGDKHI